MTSSVASGRIGGLLDIHCHGAVGAEFGTDVESSRRAVAYHRSRGADRLVASLVSASPEQLRSGVGVLATLVAEGALAGIHLEGPFLSSVRRGAHDPTMLRDPDPSLVEDLVEVASAGGAPGAIRQLTFAPELPGAEALVARLVALGIRPAVGHTDAPADVVQRTLGMVADLQGEPALVTHLFNGMPAFHHRHGGPVAAALTAAARSEAVVELITDGTHVAAEVVRMVFETVGPDAVALVSDAMAATGLGDGDYMLGSLAVRVDAGVARTAGGSIAGSTSALGDCVAWAIDVAGVVEADALRSATATPARILGLPA